MSVCPGCGKIETLYAFMNMGGHNNDDNLGMYPLFVNGLCALCYREAHVINRVIEQL